MPAPIRAATQDRHGSGQRAFAVLRSACRRCCCPGLGHGLTADVRFCALHLVRPGHGDVVAASDSEECSSWFWAILEC